jgi:formylglycine-generating enzyme required for sulfatase activity
MRSRLVAALCIGTGLGASVACSAVLGIKEFTPAEATGKDGSTSEDGHVQADGGPVSCTPGDASTGATSGLGCPCTQEGQLACNGNAQPESLICTNGAWAMRTTCPSGQNCDSRVGGSQGTCAAIDPTCMNATPNQAICSNATTAVQCGPDLVSEMQLATCSNQACVNGTCAGMCVPGEKQCFGNGYQTCGADGGWEKATACAQSCSDGGCASFPSCAAGAPGAGMDCAAVDGGAGTSDCCGSFDVKGGSFDRSYDGVSVGIGTNPSYSATVSDFRLDAYEVTVGRFRAFVDAVVGGYTPPAGSGKHAYLNGGSGLTNVGGGDAGASEPGWSMTWNANLSTTGAAWNGALGCPNGTWTSAAGSSEHRPINCVTWYEAYAFCIWDGGFLPSEAEWNYAAAGGSQQRAYPWSTLTDAGTTSTAIDCSHANYSPMPSQPCSPTGPNDVGSQSPLGDGRFGQSDLAGNVSEWTLDSFATYVNPCVDCSNVAPVGSPVQRGGSYNLVASSSLASYRASDGPAVRDGAVGFRCARSP